MLNRCDESEHLRLVPDLKEKVFNLWPLSTMLVINALYKVAKFPYVPRLLRVLIEQDVGFCEMLFF